MVLMGLGKLLSPVSRFLTGALGPIKPAARARGLAAAGLYREAIDLLSNQSPDDIDLPTLCDLVRWRNAAFASGVGCSDWPRRLPDPFPGVTAPPEIHGNELSAEILGGAIQHHGCLLVRGLIDAAQTRTLRDVVSRAIDAGEASRAAPEHTSESSWYAPYPLGPDDGMTEGARGWVASTGAVWTADSPRALSDFIAFLKTHGVIGVIEEYLGEPAYLSVGKSTLRRVPPTTGTAWHQDGAFLGPDIRTVNCWLTLSDCGDDAPGLDVYPRRLNELAEMGTRDAPLWWMVGDAVVEDMAKTTPIVSPRFKAGDALLFDQLFLHRTGARPGLTRERLAIESWFFAGSTFPMEQIPIAL
jgi:hypothetical protein